MKPIQWRKSSSACLLLALALGWLSVRAQAQSCTPSGNYDTIYPSGSIFYFSNNPYGDEGSTTNGDCISVTSTSGANTAAWYTQWTQSASNNYDVYAYPEVVFPGGSATSGLPAQLSSISSIPSTWTYTLQSSNANGFDVAYDIWVNQAENSSDTATEVMIWTNAAFGQDGTNVGTFTSGGLTFTLYQTLPADYSWTNHPVYSFCSQTQVSSVNLNLQAFLSYLVQKGYFPSSWYLTGVDAGIEIRNGSGSLKTTNYDTYVVLGSGTGSGDLIPNGTYKMTNKNSGQVVDVPGLSMTDGTYLDQWASNGGANQQWELTNLGNNEVKLVNVNSGLALEVYGASTATGGKIDQWPYDSGKNQIWQVVSAGSGYYELVNEASGLALEVPSFSQTEDADLDQWTANGGANQLWSFTEE
jgi:hypothetical protein